MKSNLFLDDERVYRVRNDRGEVDRDLLDDAWLRLNYVDTHTARQFHEAREQAKDAELMKRLAAMYAAAGWAMPSVKESRREKRRSQIREHTRARRIARRNENHTGAPSLCEWVSDAVKRFGVMRNA